MFETYRRIPYQIEAVQLTPDNAEEIAKLCGGQVVKETDPRNSTRIYMGVNVPTINGTERLSVGQHLVRDLETGRLEIMGPSRFFYEYEKV